MGESVDSSTVVPGKRKILDFFLIKLFAYFFFLISLAKHFRSLKKTLASLNVEKQKKYGPILIFNCPGETFFPKDLSFALFGKE